MNSEPCVRFGIRISPKIREKPADRRNSKPPKVMLLAVSTSQKVMSAIFPRCSSHRPRAPFWRPRKRPASGFDRREVSRINPCFEGPFVSLSPELAHVRVGLDCRIDELATGFLALADVEVSNGIPEMIKLDRAARRIGQRHRLENFHELGLVVALSAGFLQRLVDDHAVDIEA